MRTIEHPKSVRIGVRRDGESDGLIWRLYVDATNEEIAVKSIRFAGAITAETLRFETDRTRRNAGSFLAWLRVKPARIEIRNHAAYLFF